MFQIATGPVASDEDINRLLTSSSGTPSPATQYANRLTLIHQFLSTPTYLIAFFPAYKFQRSLLRSGHLIPPRLRDAAALLCTSFALLFI